jgi:hypothetical protein
VWLRAHASSNPDNICYFDADVKGNYMHRDGLSLANALRRNETKMKYLPGSKTLGGAHQLLHRSFERAFHAWAPLRPNKVSEQPISVPVGRGAELLVRLVQTVMRKRMPWCLSASKKSREMTNLGCEVRYSAAACARYLRGGEPSKWVGSRLSQLIRLRTGICKRTNPLLRYHRVQDKMSSNYC